MEIGFGFIVVVAVVVFLVAKKLKKLSEPKKTKLVIGDAYKASADKGPARTIETGTLHFSEEMTTHTVEEEHVVSEIYIFPETGDGWKCPNCECDNDRNATRCSVCNTPR